MSTPIESELNHELYRCMRVPHMLRGSLTGLLPVGLDPSAVQLLAMLVKQGPARQGELADWSFLDPSTVSRRISQLVQHGLVERQADPVDGRAVRLAAARAGVDLMIRIRDQRDQITREVLADWKPEQVLTLTELLRTFNDAADGYRRQPSTEESHDHD